MLTSIKMYASVPTTGANEAAAMIDVPADCELLGVSWSFDGDDAAGAHGRAELSLSSSQGLTTNDTRSSISTFAYAASVTTAVAGAVVNVHNLNVFFPEPIALMGNERVYIHYNNSGTFDAARLSCHLYVKLKGSGGGRTRRL